ncbi:MAG: DUF1178 family protein [Rhodobacteraceae bacterium]|nr:DUF1178 family protein [Paracoccaceae bacterium]
MIKYTLSCDNDHRFDAWFQSADGFTSQLEAGHLVCTTCGSAKIAKSLMAPAIAVSKKAAPAPPSETPPTDEPSGPLSTPANAAEDKLAALRKHVEKTSEYVGMSFAEEARAMHLGDTPERAIYGEARLEEAKKLVDDGIPVMPLPFTPRRGSN